MVYGIINFGTMPGGGFGWIQAGAPFPTGDPANNTEDLGVPFPGLPFLPDNWND